MSMVWILTGFPADWMTATAVRNEVSANCLSFRSSPLNSVVPIVFTTYTRQSGTSRLIASSTANSAADKAAHDPSIPTTTGLPWLLLRITGSLWQFSVGVALLLPYSCDRRLQAVSPAAE